MKGLMLYSLVFISFAFMPDSFRSQQQTFSRVKASYEEKEKPVTALFASAGIKLSSMNLFLRGFKEEAKLEIWAKSSGETKYQLIKTYEICSSSGNLGPKRKQGDYQVPEGFYEIDRFNPSSNFYLSLGVSYPNASDRILGNKGNLGGDIFVHGNCVTIGCLPLTDDKIKEVYLMAVEAKSGGQKKIPIHIFPFRMNEEKMKKHEDSYKKDAGTVSFWRNIRKGYDLFEKGHELPAFKVNANGEYVFDS